MNDKLYNTLLNNISNAILNAINEELSMRTLKKASSKAKKEIKLLKHDFEDSDFLDDDILKKLRRRSR